MTTKAKPQPYNRLLALLPESLQKRIALDCETKQLGLKDLIYEPDRPMSGVYFPIAGVLSFIATMDSGSEVEVATVGNEGMAGLPLFLGTDRTPLKRLFAGTGETLYLPAELFRRHLAEEPELVAVLHRFAQALMMQSRRVRRATAPTRSISDVAAGY